MAAPPLSLRRRPLARSAFALAVGSRPVRLGRVLASIGVALAVLAASPGGVRAEGPEVVIEVYTREGCPHCAAAHGFLEDLAARTPALRIEERDVVRDPEARARLEALCAEAGVHPPGVPAFRVRGPGAPEGLLLVGFRDGETTGRELEAHIAAAAGRAPPATDPGAGNDRVRLPIVGEVSARELGLPLFTVAVGIVDGANPCAMWILLFLLSLLVHVRSRARMLLVGGTFVVMSGAVYFAFLAAWLNAFRFVGFSRGIQVGLGAVALALGALSLRDAALGEGGKTLGIPEAAKPGIYARVRRILRAESLAAALAGATVLAAVVNTVELLCTAGLPALYTHVLAQRDLSFAAYTGYLLLYVAFYMLDDALMLTIAVVGLGGRKLDSRSARLLTGFSGAVMVALGAVLVLRPGWLAVGGAG